MNAGAARSWGGELEMSYVATDDLTLYGGLGLLDTEFRDFSLTSGAGTLNLSGTDFSNAPETTLSLGFRWGGQEGFFASGNVNYVGSQLSRIEGTTPRSELASYTTVDLATGYGWDNGVNLTVHAKNLFDEEYQTYLSSPNELASYGRGREIGVLVRTTF